jgi:hypothetical protein
VARDSGVLSALHVRIQADGSACRRSGRSGYGLGSGGTWHVTTHPVLADGRPDMSATLATQDLVPCAESASVVDVIQGVVRLTMNVAVTKGQEYATVFRNTDPAPAANYTSPNFLYTSTGIVGANGRNERNKDAADAYYGLDPRELVGYSTNGGATWNLPGGPYGTLGGKNFLPTYIQEYATGHLDGQPYYRTDDASTADRTMVFPNVPVPWTIRALGAFTLIPGNGTLTLYVDGTQRAQANVNGTGMLRATIPPITVNPGQTVKVTATGLSIQNMTADSAWGRLLGMQLSTKRWYVENEPNFSAAAPVYPLPLCGRGRQRSGLAVL